MTTALARLFAERSGTDSANLPLEALETRLQDLVKVAQSTWPRVSLDGPTFIGYLAEKVAADSDPVSSLDTLCSEDLYLACACARDDSEAIALFEREMLSGVAIAIRRIDASPAFIGEVEQQTRLRLLVADGDRPKRITTYQGRGRLRSWVQVAAVRLAIEHTRRPSARELSEDHLMDTPAASDDPELAHIRMMYRKEFSEAFKEALGSLSSRERNILRMYLLDGLNIAEIGAVYRVHRATIARWIAKSREDLLKDTRDRLVSKLRISESQFQSLMAVVRSHLELSLERFLNIKDMSGAHKPPDSDQ